MEITSTHRRIWYLQHRKTREQTKLIKPMVTTIEAETREVVDVEVIIEVMAVAGDAAVGKIIEVNTWELVDVEAITKVVTPAEDVADQSITEEDNMELVDVAVIIEVDSMVWVDMEEASNNTADSMSGPMANQEVKTRTVVSWVPLSLIGSQGIRTT